MASQLRLLATTPRRHKDELLTKQKEDRKKYIPFCHFHRFLFSRLVSSHDHLSTRNQNICDCKSTYKTNKHTEPSSTHVLNTPFPSPRSSVKIYPLFYIFHVRLFDKIGIFYEVDLHTTLIAHKKFHLVHHQSNQCIVLYLIRKILHS